MLTWATQIQLIIESESEKYNERTFEMKSIFCTIFLAIGLTVALGDGEGH